MDILCLLGIHKFPTKKMKFGRYLKTTVRCKYCGEKQILTKIKRFTTSKLKIKKRGKNV
jgi:hypothetical protein